MNCWPLFILALVFGSMIGALIMVIKVKWLDNRVSDAKRRLLRHLNEIDEHTQGLEDRE